jgi:hypothetical protein
MDESRKTRSIKHGMEGTREYRCWAHMKERCMNPKHKQYSDYGGRGITVCLEWQQSFEAFYADMGPMPSNLTLERLNNDKGYLKENCAWATRKQQAQNRRPPQRQVERKAAAW